MYLLNRKERLIMKVYVLTEYNIWIEQDTILGIYLYEDKAEQELEKIRDTLNVRFHHHYNIKEYEVIM